MASSPRPPSSSPKWIRPTEVLNLRKKYRRQSSGLALQPINSNILANRFKGPLSTLQNAANFNPFRKFPQKRKIENVLQENSESFDGLLPIEKADGPKTVATEQNAKSWTPALFDETANSAVLPIEVKEKVKAPPERIAQLPLDWSLKTRLRFMSTKHFSYRGCLKTSEEASGTTGFVRCIHSTKVQECSVDTSANAKFHQQCLVWQHPALPWLKLFPRTHDPKATELSLFASNQVLQESLHNDWAESLRSLFQLVRARQCPFFYLCAGSFTVLFRAAGVNGLSDTHALFTPTTSGIRKLLRSQGIEFNMPFCTKFYSQDQDTSLEESCLNFELGEDKASELKEENEEEPEVFLESLGLSQQDFPSLNPKRKKIDVDGERGCVDLRPESLVCMEGPDTQALLDLLINNRNLSIPTTGPLAGVPPTLLGPCAFHGAVLRPVKARQGWVKQGNRNMHCIDLSGPILPNMVQGLTSLFSNTQEGEFSVVLASEPTTSSFSSVPLEQESCIVPRAFAEENLKDCGLSAEFLMKMCSSSKRAVLHEIDVQDRLFCWR